MNYCRLESGEIMIVHSQNKEKETMELQEISSLRHLYDNNPKLRTVAFHQIDQIGEELEKVVGFK